MKLTSRLCRSRGFPSLGLGLGLGLGLQVERDESDRIFMQIAIFNQHFWITIRVRVIRDIRNIRVRSHDLVTPFFFYKNTVYKNTKAQYPLKLRIS
jgi:hypothetical protein